MCHRRRQGPSAFSWTSTTNDVSLLEASTQLNSTALLKLRVAVKPLGAALGADTASAGVSGPIVRMKAAPAMGQIV
jgi:hypothetical protein